MPVATPAAGTAQSVAAHPAGNVLIPTQLVRAETNMLYFPFFCLSKKVRKDLDFIEVTGTKPMDGVVHEYLYRVSRNTDYPYPGILSRKVHMALLNRLSDPKSPDHSFPFQNPIRFGWRDLARRANCAWSGNTIKERMKLAIASTHGIVITSNYALWQRTDDGKLPLPKRQRGYGLYDEYKFIDDDDVQDNMVWLADWYLASLNNLRTSAPLDYALWQALDAGSPTASRLYECIQYRFCAKTDVLRINYHTLCPFVPLAVMLQRSRAETQLNPSLSLLQSHGVLRDWRWTESKKGEIQLILYRGPVLKQGARRSRGVPAESESDLFETTSVRHGSCQHSPEEALVRRFHALWSRNENHRPWRKEVAYAHELIAAIGEELANRLLSKVVRDMRMRFPAASTFGGTRTYFEEAIKRHRIRERETAPPPAGKQQPTPSRQASSVTEPDVPALTEAWNRCSPKQQAAIVDAALSKARSQFDRDRISRDVADSRAGRTPLDGTFHLRFYLLEEIARVQQER